MAQHDMAIQRVVWDDRDDSATFTLVETDSPPRPTVQGESAWWPGPGTSVTVTVPIKRPTVTNPTGILVTPGTEPGTVIYTKYEWRNGTWVSLGRVNPDGTPWTG